MGLKTLLTAAGLILALNTAQAENPEFIINPYLLTGTSITNNVEPHYKAGLTFSQEITENHSFGLDFGKLQEGDLCENFGGFRYSVRDNAHTTGLNLGISEVTFKEPLYLYDNNGTERRSTKENTLYLGLDFTKKVWDNLKARINYQRNFAPQELLDLNYPQDRISLGVEAGF